MPLGDDSTTKSDQEDASAGETAALDEPTGQSEITNFDGLTGGLAQPRVRKVSVIDRMPSGVTGVGDVFTVGTSDVTGIGLGSPVCSPTYPNQRSPMFWCQPSLLPSSPFSLGGTMFPFSREEVTSRDSVIHPFPTESKTNLGVSGVTHCDEIDAKENRKDVNALEEQDEQTIKELLEAPMPVEPNEEEYPMTKNRRIATIFNHDSFQSEPERSGSIKDVEALRVSLKYLEFDVTVHNNLTREEIADELDRLVNVGFVGCDCFCVVVLTHGEAPEVLHARDGIYQQSELWMRFIPDNCPTLAGKPKLFFIQACRGNGLNKGVRLVKYSNTSQTDSRASWSYVIPSWADFLIAHSTPEGFYAWRDPLRGSWWIQTLCEELKSRGSTSDLLKILTVVHRRVAIERESYVEGKPHLTGCKTIPSFTSTLMRDLYFKRKVLDSSIEPSTSS